MLIRVHLVNPDQVLDAARTCTPTRAPLREEGARLRGSLDFRLLEGRLHRKALFWIRPVDSELRDVEVADQLLARTSIMRAMYSVSSFIYRTEKERERVNFTG